jgi:hypothetical protein
VSQFDLQNAFPSLGAAPENLKYEARSVYDLDLQSTFEVALLHRRQGVIDDNKADLLRLYFRRDRFN